MEYCTLLDRLDDENKYYESKIENYEKFEKGYKSLESVCKYMPIKITLQTTRKCNLSCIMCMTDRLNYFIPQDMDIEYFKKVTQELFPTLLELHPTNIGEPLCSPWFKKMVTTMKMYGVMLDLTTNGTLITKEIAELILPVLSDIKISFDGAEKETFETIRRGAVFDTVCNNIRQIVQLRDEKKSYNNTTITLQMTLMKKNIHQLPAVVDLAYQLGVDRIKAYHVFSNSPDMDKEIAIEGSNEILREAYNIGKRRGLEMEIAELSATFKDYQIVERPCSLLWAESFIDVDGKVYPCHSHGGDSCGNLQNGSFAECWNSDMYKELRKSISNSKPIWHCKNCGMNWERVDEKQPVPYDVDNFKLDRTYDSPNIRWSSRMRQFEQKNNGGYKQCQQ